MPRPTGRPRRRILLRANKFAATTTRSPPSRNTVHLRISRVVGGRVRDLSVRLLTGCLLCFRFTPRLALRLRRGGRSSWRISSSTASCSFFKPSGGKNRESRQGSAHHVDRMGEGDPVRILFPPQCALMHQPTQREVSQQQPPDLLPHQVRLHAAQHRARSAHVGLEFVERGLELPALPGQLRPHPRRGRPRRQAPAARGARSSAGAASGSRIVVMSRYNPGLPFRPRTVYSMTRTTTPSPIPRPTPSRPPLST